MKNGKIKFGYLIFLLASACGLQGQDFDKMVENLIDGSVNLIQPDSLFNLKNENIDILVLDARAKEEYVVSHIEGAIWVGYKEFDISKIQANKNQEVVVYCSVGYRSEKIGEELQEAGFNKVNNLYGGIFAWNNAGYPIVDNSSNETKKIHAYNNSWGKWITQGEKVYD